MVKAEKIENLKKMMAAETQKLSRKEEALSEVKIELSSLRLKYSSLEIQLKRSERKNETFKVCTSSC